MQAPPLTRRQIQIVDFLRDYQERNGMAPTLDEIAQHFELNKVTIFGHVAELERKGVLVRAQRGVSRALRLVEDADAGAARPGVDVLGAIAAGAPIEALENPERLDFADLLPPDAEVYALRVQGDSMIEDGIHDGDVVLVERRSTARDGQIVVAVLPDEVATLKRFYTEGSRFRLEPANARLRPIYTDQVEIRGVVLGVIRRYAN